MLLSLAFLYYKSLQANKDLEKKLEVKNDALSALEAQQTEQSGIVESLQQQVDNLLNIEEPDPIITSTQIQEQLTAVKELTTKEYIYTNAARQEANKTWLWGWNMPFSDTSLLVTYDGIIRAGIDLSKVQIDINESSRTITVSLPDGEILSSDIPQETINVLEVKNNLFNEITFSDYNAFISAEKPAMEAKAIERGLLTDARDEAKNIISAFLKVLPGIDTYQLDIK